MSQFQGTSGFLEVWNPVYKTFPGDNNVELDFCKFRFSDKNEVVLIPHVSKLAEKRQFQAISRLPENFLKFPGLMKY